MPYRLIYDDPGAEGWIDGPSVDDAHGNPIPVTWKSFSRRWFRSLLEQRVDAADALAILLEGNTCDRRVLRDRLFRLTTPLPGPVSREEVERAAQAVKRAATAVLRIEISSLARTVDPDRRPAAKGGVKRHAARSPRPRPGAGSACALRRGTDWPAARCGGGCARRRRDRGEGGGRRFHRNLAYTTEAHTKWRQRHQGLLKAQSLPDEPNLQAIADERTVEARRLRKERHHHRHITTALFAARRLFPESFPKPRGDPD